MILTEAEEVTAGHQETLLVCDVEETPVADGVERHAADASRCRYR